MPREALKNRDDERVYVCQGMPGQSCVRPFRCACLAMGTAQCKAITPEPTIQPAMQAGDEKCVEHSRQQFTLEQAAVCR